MKSTWHILVLSAVLSLVFAACSSDTETTAPPGEAAISGVVTDASSGAVVEGASVIATSVLLGTNSAVTDAEGKFRISFELDSTTTVTLAISKSGYRDTSFIVPISSGNVATLPIRLTPRSSVVPGGSDGGSGLAQTIAFLGAEPRQVTVYGVGGNETSVLGWEVRDSLGFPIDAQHAVLLSFTMSGGPQGGEYISPSSITTNQNGTAYTTFNAGITSGVVQVTATASVAGRVIRSSPVRVIIAAGFADQAHFSIGPARHNFAAGPGLPFGRRLPISVLVGDKYSNPVAPNTALYFNSSAGVIQPSVFTDLDGEGVVDLISGNPYPPTGYHYVRARTVGEANSVVTDSTYLLWSGETTLTNLSPTTFDIPNGGFQDFSFTVSDVAGHPLSSGTTISVIAQIPPPPDPLAPINQVHVAFGLNGTVLLADYLTGGPGRTDFQFTLSDGTINIDQATAVTLTVTVVSDNNRPNVTYNYTIHGTAH